MQISVLKASLLSSALCRHFSDILCFSFLFQESLVCVAAAFGVFHYWMRCRQWRAGDQLIFITVWGKHHNTLIVLKWGQGRMRVKLTVIEYVCFSVINGYLLKDICWQCGTADPFIPPHLFCPQDFFLGLDADPLIVLYKTKTSLKSARLAAIQTRSRGRKLLSQATGHWDRGSGETGTVGPGHTKSRTGVH